jgi:hypothetical protein
MERAGKDDPIENLEKEFPERGIACVRERFRVPAFPRISPVAGYAICSAGALLLAAGRTDASFLIGLSGALVLLLDACGFSPLDWLGPKEARSVLVVPGTFSEEKRKALFLGVPLSCRLTRAGYFSREATYRRVEDSLGFVLSLALPVFAGAATLRYLPPFPPAGLAAAAMAILAARRWARAAAPPCPGNLALKWVDRWVPGEESGFRPFILIYSGDEAEVKFFLAKYRYPLLRGEGVFLEFPETASGPPAVSAREGAFLLPYRVDAGLIARVLQAGKAGGVPFPRMQALRFESAGLVSMARGFRAVTLFRLEGVDMERNAFSEESAIGWVNGILDERRAGHAGRFDSDP